jgi:hypothetical protein
LKFALVTADASHRNKFRINPETGDATSFMQWVSIFDGVHLSFESLRKEDNNFLKEFDVVMMSGHPSYVADIIRIAKFLKHTNAVSMFYPEGSAQLYDNSVNGFHPEYYEAWMACDILSIAEEDKEAYYESIVTEETLVCFIHVPMTAEMTASAFYAPRSAKHNGIVVYGDNNPNHPVIAFAAIERLCRLQTVNFDVIGVETRNAEFSRIFPNLPIRHISKQAQYPFLRLLRQTLMSFYPTEWIGTARHQISCAATGTPCIGSRESHTQQRLFPKLATGIYEVDKMANLGRELMNSESFYTEVTDYARNQMRHYDLGTTVDRFMRAVESARVKFKKASVPV